VLAEFPEYAFPIGDEFAARHALRVARGRERMRASRVVIAGLVRNAIEVLPHTIERIDRLAKLFADFRVVVYENDSSDGTPELLQAWAAGVRQVTAISEVRGAPVNPGSRCQHRADRMADYRNRYHAYIAERFPNFDHVIVVDMDLIGGWSEDGIANTFGWDDWDFVGANGLVLQRVRLRFNSWLHYDTWAFRRYGSFEPMCTKTVNHFAWHRGEPLQPVSSCFGGLGIYQMPAFLSARYAGGDCEHVTFHYGMRAAGFDRLFLNPSQLVFYGRKIKPLQGVVNLYNHVRSVYARERIPA
jgi:glycosyltransferase involved in cell wall biosynthesis